MKSFLVQLDDETMSRLEQVAPVRNRARTEFVRRAIKAALHQSEFDRIRDSYLKDPQVFEDGGDWDDPLEWNPKASAEGNSTRSGGLRCLCPLDIVPCCC